MQFSASRSVEAKYAEVNAAQLAVEIAVRWSTECLKNVLSCILQMVSLQFEISRQVTGFVHVQPHPYYTYDTQKDCKSSRRVCGSELSSCRLGVDYVRFIELFKYFDLSFDGTRVCIKISSTWEGLQAYRILESSHITTLATTLFTLEQASLACEIGCHYIAPYLNELKVHFEAA